MTTIANSYSAVAAPRTASGFAPRRDWARAGWLLADTRFDLVQIDGERYRLTVDVSGYDASELSVDQYPNALVIAGECDRDRTGDSRRSRFHRSFRRVFPLPDQARITDASLARGLLSVDLKTDPPRAGRAVRVPISHAKPDGTLTRLVSRVKAYFGRLAARIA